MLHWYTRDHANMYSSINAAQHEYVMALEVTYSNYYREHLGPSVGILIHSDKHLLGWKLIL